MAPGLRRSGAMLWRVRLRDGRRRAWPYDPDTASTARGLVRAIASKVRAAPLGCLRPCSQAWSVRTDTPRRAANRAECSPSRPWRTWSEGTARLLQAGWASRRQSRATLHLDDCIFSHKCYHFAVNGSQRKTLEKVLADPVNGNIEWARIESMLKAAGCRAVEGAGSSITFEFGGRKMTLHRPHPGKEALRYRVLAVREFIARMGIEP